MYSCIPFSSLPRPPFVTKKSSKIRFKFIIKCHTNDEMMRICVIRRIIEEEEMMIVNDELYR